MSKVTLPVLNMELRTVLKSLAADIATGVLDGKKIHNLYVDNLIGGTITSKTITLAVTDGAGDVYINAGKTDFTNTQSGFILGLDDSDSNRAKFYLGDSSNYLNWNGLTLSIRGSLNADDITAGTLTGRTVIAKSGTTGTNIALDSSAGAAIFKYNNTNIGSIASDSTSSMLYSSNANHLFFGASGAGIMTLNTDGLTLSGSRHIFMQPSTTISWSDGPYIEDGGSTIIFGPTNLSIRPATNGAGDCGTSSRKWNYIYAQNSGIGDIVIFDKYCPICEKELKINENFIFRSYKLNPEKHDGIHAVPVHLDCAINNNKDDNSIRIFIESKSKEYEEWRKIKYKDDFEEDEIRNKKLLSGKN